ncbi:hypothetical protein HZS_6021 [Henneguya salminicola]|nr:hypothetical protein HZS_6021 [Henneguya salminicola]
MTYARAQTTMANKMEEGQRVLIKVRSDDGLDFGGTLDVSVNLSKAELNSICNLYEKNSQKYSFYIKEEQITGFLKETLKKLNLNTESVVEVTCRPDSLINVRSVTRCTSSLPGHSAAITSISFSPHAQFLASGSGDTSVRLWDIHTETPSASLNGHKDWILALAWSPTGHLLASGDKSGLIIIWDVEKGAQKFPPLKAHKNWITYISWEPLHLYRDSFRFASSSKVGSNNYI